jgi:hypothetical protein
MYLCLFCSSFIRSVLRHFARRCWNQTWWIVSCVFSIYSFVDSNELMSLGDECKFYSPPPRDLNELLLRLLKKRGDNSIYTCDANAPRWTTFRGWKTSSFGGGKASIWNQLTAEVKFYGEIYNFLCDLFTL